jgi:hypothetical protein
MFQGKLRLEHIAQEFFHFCVSDDFSEKRFLDFVGSPDSQVCQQHQQSTKSGDVTRRAKQTITNK